MKVMKKEPVLFSVEDNTAIIIINRPEVHNSINEAAILAFEEIMDKVEEDDDIRSIILTGAGNESFCSGGDLKYFATLKTKKNVRIMSERMQRILSRLWEGDKPVIAAINGQAFGGGCEIITACHLRIAASNAQFVFHHAANGIITGWGGGLRFFNQVGHASALPLLLTSEKVGAVEALRIGLVYKVVKSERLLSESLGAAQKINKNSQAAVKKLLELARVFKIEKPEATKKFETDAFLELWLGGDFQQVLNKYSS
jgi:enoyl-CoA hydratase/carnithine racemase